MYKTILFSIYICILSTNHFNITSDYHTKEEIYEFKYLRENLSILKDSLSKESKNKNFFNDEDILLVNKTIENVDWLETTALRTKAEVSFGYLASLTKLSVATKKLSSTKNFTEKEANEIFSIYTDIYDKCAAVQSNTVIGFKGVKVTVKTTDRNNIEKKGFVISWAFSFDDRHNRNIKESFSQHSSTTTELCFIPGYYVFWPENLNSDGTKIIIAGPKQNVHIQASDNNIDLYVN